MEDTTATCKSTPQSSDEVKSLIERAQRTDGPYEVTMDEFKKLLAEGGQINGILDVKHEEGWKTQQWIMDPETGHKFYFFVYADAPGQWSNAQ